MTWELLLEARIRFEIPERDFWNMSLRDFERFTRVKSNVLKEEHERQLMITAISTSYMMNMVGGAAAGNKWKQVRPSDLFRTWTQADKTAPFRDRWEAAMKLHNDRVSREKAKKVTN